MTDVERNAILGNVQRQYVGARYVPKFFQGQDGTPTWVGNVPYEALTIVTYLGNSYTSKVPVPSGIGNPSQNPTYWALTGNYNAQVEEIRKELLTVNDNISTLKNNQIEWVNVKNKGADNTGIVDCAPIIATISSNVIYFPEGTYLLNNSVNLKDKTIIGDNSTIYSNMSDATFILDTCTIIGLNFDVGGCAISAKNSKIIGCNFNVRSTTAGPTAFTIEIISGTSAALIKDCTIKVPLNVPCGDGVHIYGNVKNVTIDNCYIDTSDDSVALNSREGDTGPITNIKITNCTLKGYGVRLYGRGESQKIEDVYISNCLIDCDNIACIRALNSVNLDGDTTAELASVKRLCVSNCTLTTSKESSSGLQIRGLYTACANCDFVFTNVYFHNKNKPNIFFIPVRHTTSIGTINEKFINCIFESPNAFSNDFLCTKNQMFIGCEFKCNLVIGNNQKSIFTNCSFPTIGSANNISGSDVNLNMCTCPVAVVLTGNNIYRIIDCNFGNKANGSCITGDSNATYFIKTYKNLITVDTLTIKRISGNVAYSGVPTTPQEGDFYYYFNSNTFTLRVYKNGTWL